MLLCIVSIGVSSSVASRSLQGFQESLLLSAAGAGHEMPGWCWLCLSDLPEPASCSPGLHPLLFSGDFKQYTLGSLPHIPHSRCSPAVSCPTSIRLLTSPVRLWIWWNDERSCWMTWTAMCCDAPQVQMILDKSPKQNSDLNRTNGTNCTPNYSYLQFLLLVKKSQAEISLFCISYWVT